MREPGKSGSRPASCGADGPPPAVILLVEDEILIRMAVAEALRDAGFCVLEAAHAAEALALFDRARHVNLLITDINMPGVMDGLALAAEVSARRPDLPVVLATARPPQDDQVRYDHIVVKPYEASMLVTVAEEIMGATWQTRKRDQEGGQQAC